MMICDMTDDDRKFTNQYVVFQQFGVGYCWKNRDGNLNSTNDIEVAVFTDSYDIAAIVRDKVNTKQKPAYILKLCFDNPEVTP